MRGLLLWACCLKLSPCVLWAARRGSCLIWGCGLLGAHVSSLMIIPLLSFSPHRLSLLLAVELPIQKSRCWLQIWTLLQRWQEKGGLHPSLSLQEVLIREGTCQENSPQWHECPKHQARPPASWEERAAGDGGKRTPCRFPWRRQEISEGGVWGKPCGGWPGTGTWWGCKELHQMRKDKEHDWWLSPGRCWACLGQHSLWCVLYCHIAYGCVTIARGEA